jgi:Flp pilus assembly pilin Flp
VKEAETVTRRLLAAHPSGSSPSTNDGDRSLARDTRGESMVEYLIIVGVVALLAITAFTGFGSQVAHAMRDQMLDPAKMGL